MSAHETELTHSSLAMHNMYQWTSSLLAQVVACHQFSARWSNIDLSFETAGTNFNMISIKKCLILFQLDAFGNVPC